jgi:adenylate cyclase
MEARSSKFIGDAMLAIFPVEDDAVAASRNALGAVRVAKAAVNEENERRASAGKPRIRYGLALHVGDVMYGNIGGDTRLDFTVIGPAVNLTSRIESMCKTLDRSPLLSAEFARLSGVEAEYLGKFELKGVAEKQLIYGLRE